MRRHASMGTIQSPSASTRWRLLAVLFIVLAVIPGSSSRAAETNRKVAVVAFGLFGDQSVFESEASGAARIVAARTGGAPVIVHANSRTRSDATVEALASALDAAAKEIDAERDVLVVILTSHGSQGGLAVRAPGEPDDILWPQILSAFLDHAGVRHRVVIVSACYSGVFIPLLANPDTLVITAADAFHPSFGCQDGALWTYFGDALFNTAMRRTASLREAFEFARSLVRERELRNGFDPSNPQIAGGENIDIRLTGPIEPGEAADHAGEPEALALPLWRPIDATLLPWPTQ